MPVQEVKRSSVLVFLPHQGKDCLGILSLEVFKNVSFLVRLNGLTDEGRGVGGPTGIRQKTEH